MDLTAKLLGILQRKGNRTPPASDASIASSPPPPVGSPVGQSSEGDSDWLKGIDELLARLDQTVPSTARGSNSQEVTQALEPHMVLDFGQAVNAVRMMGFAWTMGFITGTCAGYATCPGCGDAIAPTGSSPGTHVMNCGSCNFPITITLVEYSPVVGRQIRETLRSHFFSVQEMKRAEELHAKDQGREAAELALRVVADFRKRGHRLAQADTLLYASGYLRSFDPVQARRSALNALAIFIDHKGVSGFIRALYRLAVSEWDHDMDLAQALVTLAQDVSRTHPPEFEGLAYHARSLFLEAAFAADRVLTFSGAQERLRTAHRFLIDAANRPRCAKLLAQKIEEQFSFVRDEINRLTLDVSDLLKRTHAAYDAKDDEASHAVLTDLLKVAIQLGDFRTIRDVANQLALLCFKREDLAGAMEHWRTMEMVCRRLNDAKSLSSVLQNRAVLLEVLEQNVEAQKLREESELIQHNLKSAEERLPSEKAAAEAATKQNDWERALALWSSVCQTVATLEDRNERYQTLVRIAKCQAKLDRRLPHLLTLLELEAVGSTHSGILTYALCAQAEAWKALGDEATAGGRLARAVVALNDFLSEPRGDPERALAVQQRQLCLTELRRIGDAFAGKGDLGAAERMYTLLVSSDEHCLQKSPTDASLRLSFACNLDELGFTIVRSGEERKTEGQKLIKKAIDVLDDLDRDKPDGKDARGRIRAKVAEHLNSTGA